MPSKAVDCGLQACTTQVLIVQNTEKLAFIDTRFATVVSSLYVYYNHLSWTMCVESVEINGCQGDKHSNAVVRYKFAQCMEKFHESNEH